MKIIASIFLAATMCQTIRAEDPSVPDQYERFQGRWKLVAHAGSLVAPGGSLLPQSAVPEVFVDVVGQSFVLHGAGVANKYRKLIEYRVPADSTATPYRYLHEEGIGNMGDLIEVHNQIAVSWWIGIYRFENDHLQLALMYCGQGVEGEAAKYFRPPSSFDLGPANSEARLTLKRVVIDVGELLTSDDVPE